jgi:hypothetical protein
MRRLLLRSALLAPLAFLGPPALVPPAAAQPAEASILTAFVHDATTYTALPWQQEALGLSDEQVAALQGIAQGRQRTIQEVFEELRMLFEHVAMLDRPVDAREAFALYYDVAAHKGEALLVFREAAEAMLGVLTSEQREAWAHVLEEAVLEHPPLRVGGAPVALPPQTEAP